MIHQRLTPRAAEIKRRSEALRDEITELALASYQAREDLAAPARVGAAIVKLTDRLDRVLARRDELARAAGVRIRYRMVLAPPERPAPAEAVADFEHGD